MIVGRDYEYGDELPFVGANHAGFAEYPFLLDLDELELERRRVREALARKRPAGFSAWLDDAESGLRRVA